MNTIYRASKICQELALFNASQVYEKAIVEFRVDDEDRAKYKYILIYDFNFLYFFTVLSYFYNLCAVPSSTPY